jgi:hypothetical protein
MSSVTGLYCRSPPSYRGVAFRRRPKTGGNDGPGGRLHVIGNPSDLYFVALGRGSENNVDGAGVPSLGRPTDPTLTKSVIRYHRNQGSWVCLKADVIGLGLRQRW